MKPIQFTLIAVCIAIVSFVSSCKKKDSTAPATSGGGGTTGGLITNGIYGNMQATYTDHDYGSGMLVQDSAVMVNFFENPMSAGTSNSIYGGTVTVNGVSLIFNGSSYTLPVSTFSIKDLSWSATGSGTVAAFSYSYTPVYPKLSTPVSLPDTLYKSAGISVPFNGITNASSALVYVSQGSNFISKNITASSGTVTFSPAELANFSTNSAVFVDLVLANITHQTVGSANYQFSVTYSYQKSGYLK